MFNGSFMLSTRNEKLTQLTQVDGECSPLRTASPEISIFDMKITSTHSL